jgi:hypothetical protein
MAEPSEPPEFSPAWFDAASAAWLLNKRKIGSGSYRYRCEHAYSAWRTCNRDVYKTERFCRQHYALNQNAQFRASLAGRRQFQPKPESPKYQ